jgi:phosphoglycolate phosphatase-like HAD superfamily hydrolase
LSTLFIWDIDGTLIDCQASGRIALDIAFYRCYGLKNATQGVNLGGKLDSVIIGDVIERNNLRNFEYIKFNKVYKRTLEKVLKNNGRKKILGGIENILDISEKAGITNMIGTGNMKYGANIKLKSLAIDRYFKVGSYGDTSFTRVQMIERAKDIAKEYYNREFESYFVIGDTPHDITGGKGAKCHTVAVATGRYSKDTLMEHSPDLIFEHLDDTKEFFKSINMIIQGRN